METLRFDLRMWLSSYGELNTEEATLDFYRTTYKSKIAKKELEQHLTSLEVWHQYAYERKLLFELTGFDEVGQPYASLLFNDGNSIIRFLDEHGRVYMIYTFNGSYQPGYLFLESLHYFEYEEEGFQRRSDSASDIEYGFRPNGQLVVYKEYTKADGHRYQSKEEAAHPVNVQQNWEPYPNFGRYQRIVRMKRWQEGDLLKGIAPLN